jgi:hypothetical protein
VSESPELPETITVVAGIGALTAATVLGEASSHEATGLLILDVVVALVGCAIPSCRPRSPAG